jgi:hypothetical protein
VTVRAKEWALVAVILIAIAIAVVARGNLGVSIPSSALAVGLAMLLGLSELWGPASRAGSGRTRSSLRPSDVAHTPDLRSAFSSGEMGRERIVAEIERLERAFRPDGSGRIDPAEVRRLRHVPPEEFGRWLSGRIDEIERSA